MGARVCWGSKQKTNQNFSDLNVNFNCNVVLESTGDSVKCLASQCGDGSSYNIYPCNSKICKLKKNFTAKDKVFSTATTRFYDVTDRYPTPCINCHSPNVIYLITCTNCHLQYVGETALKLNLRFNNHRQGISKPEKYGF